VIAVLPIFTRTPGFAFSPAPNAGTASARDMNAIKQARNSVFEWGMGVSPSQSLFDKLGAVNAIS
jgi:hypothetical protein